MHNQLRQGYHKLRGLWLWGHRRFCPLCEKSFRRFLPKGEPIRTEAMCPRCLSLERHRLLWLYLTRELHVHEKKGSLLHFAPEPSLRQLLEQLSGIQYVTVDMSPGRGQVAVNLEQLGLHSEKFDWILCCHVLEHVPNDEAAMNELYRVLKPGGMAILQVPLCEGPTDEDRSVTDPIERARRFGQDDHVRLYGNDFVSRLELSGFEVSVVDFAHKVSPQELIRSQLMAEGVFEDRIFVGKKKIF